MGIFQRTGGGGSSSSGGVTSFAGRNGVVVPVASDYSRLVPNGLYDVVAEYGAKGDGSTDDTAAINTAIAALNAAGTGELWFGAGATGTFLCTGALTPITAASEVSGAYGTTLKCHSGIGSNAVFMTLGANSEIEDLQFDVSGGSGAAIIQMGGENSKVSHCTFLNQTIDIGIRMSNTEQSVHDCLFNDTNAATSYGTIQIDAGSYRAIIHDNTFEGVNPSGAPLIRSKAGGLEFTIVDNTAANCSATYAVLIEAGAGDWIHVVGNNFINIPISNGATGSHQLIADNPARINATAQSGTYTAVGGDLVLCTAGSGGFTVTLPPAISGTQVMVKKVDSGAGNITISPASGNIDGSGSQTLSSQYSHFNLVADGTNWWIL